MAQITTEAQAFDQRKAERNLDRSLDRGRCVGCGTKADADGYCVDPGCFFLGKLVGR